MLNTNIYDSHIVSKSMKKKLKKIKNSCDVKQVIYDIDYYVKENYGLITEVNNTSLKIICDKNIYELKNDIEQKLNNMIGDDMYLLFELNQNSNILYLQNKRRVEL